MTLMIIMYLWVLVSFGVVGYNGWNVYRRPHMLSLWIFLGVSIGFSLASVVTYANVVFA